MRIARVRMPIVVGSVVVVAAAIVLAQSVLAQGSEPPRAASRERTAGDAMPGLPRHVWMAAERLGLQLDTSRKIAQNLYLLGKQDGQLCMVSTSHGMSMGCGPADSFFEERAVQYSIDESGQPEAPSSLTIAGVVRPDVASVRVVFPSGPIEVSVSSDGGFSIDTTEQQLQQGRPTELVALGDDGQVIQALALPQG